MKIYHYIHDNSVDECASDNPWKDCLFTAESVLNDYDIKPLVSINGLPIIRQHQSTYITGKETCHAHHYAKMIATAILSGEYSAVPGLIVHDAVPVRGSNAATPRSVLWIDTINGPHTCAHHYNEMLQRFQADNGEFNLICLDLLGVFRYDFYDVINTISECIRKFRPSLVVVDDIDHFMPQCGINVASRFNRIVRDTLNHTETAFLFIGYNNLNKRASTTGDLGRILFPCSNNIFSITTQNDMSKVRLIKGTSCSAPDTAFHFTIGSDNMPQAASGEAMSPSTGKHNVVQTTLRDIMEAVIKPGETISPDNLLIKLNERRQQLNRINRSRSLIAQALSLDIIKKSNDTHHYFLTPSQPVEVVQATGLYTPNGFASPNDASPNTQSINDKDTNVNNILTLPPLLSHNTSVPFRSDKELQPATSI